MICSRGGRGGGGSKRCISSLHPVTRSRCENIRGFSVYFPIMYLWAKLIEFQTLRNLGLMKVLQKTSEKLNMYRVCPVGSLAELSFIKNPYLMKTGRK